MKRLLNFALLCLAFSLFGIGINIISNLEPTSAPTESIAKIEATTEPPSASPTTMIMTPKRQVHRFVPMTTPPGAGYGGVGAR
jgi:hypothetical protein